MLVRPRSFRRHSFVRRYLFTCSTFFETVAGILNIIIIMNEENGPFF